MTKSAEAFRTISEVADWLDTPTHVLRFWEVKFSQIKPVKRAGGRRYYRPQDMLLIGGIKKLLHSDGLTIKAVQKILSEQGRKYVCSLSKTLDGEDNTPDTPVDARPPMENNLLMNEASWKPIGLTSLATDLGEDGQMTEPDPAERDLPDFEIEQIQGLGRSAVDEIGGPEIVRGAKTNEAASPSNGATADGISSMTREEISESNPLAADIRPKVPGKSKQASKKKIKKALELFDDDQLMLNLWESDEALLEDERADITHKKANQEVMPRSEEDLRKTYATANFPEAVTVSELAEPNDRFLGNAAPPEVGEEFESENVAINAYYQDEVSGAIGEATEASHDDTSVTVDIVTDNANATEETVSQKPVDATLRSIEDHLDGHPKVSPVHSKALRSGLIALENAIAKRRGSALTG